ncbi:MAG: hypothetical protein KDB27_23775 [Planctomycetales bacterium]|nr:hypothetical protein [Planctomycetales bacterium]
MVNDDQSLDDVQAKCSDRRYYFAVILRYGIACLLVTAALLKTHELGSRPVAAFDLWSKKVVVLGAVQIEVFLATWLFLGIRRRGCWTAVTLCFTIFTGVTIARGFQGAASCGCFGKVMISPWLTAAFDIAVLSALIALRQSFCAENGRVSGLSVLLTCVAFVGAGSCLAWWGSSYQPHTLAADGVIAGSDGFVLLEPEKWIGERLPLMNYLDSDAIGHGKWTVMLHKHDCSRCRQILPSFVKEKGQLALIEIPPFGESELMRIPATVVQIALEPKYDWFVTTPVELHLDDGIVTGVRHNFQE